jgi:hypothetical protein
VRDRQGLVGALTMPHLLVDSRLMSPSQPGSDGMCGASLCVTCTCEERTPWAFNHAYFCE